MVCNTRLIGLVYISQLKVSAACCLVGKSRAEKRILKPRIYNNAVILSTFIYNLDTHRDTHTSIHQRRTKQSQHACVMYATSYRPYERDFLINVFVCENLKRNDINTFGSFLYKSSVFVGYPVKSFW